MKVHLRQIQADGLHLEGEEEFPFPDLAAEGVGCTGPLRYSLDLGISEGSLWVTGYLAQPVELKLETKTLGGEPQVAEGSVKIYDLQPPENVQRAPLAEPHYRYRSYPSDQSDRSEPSDLSNPNNWPLGKVVAEKGFTTDTNGLAKSAFKSATPLRRSAIS